MATNTHRWTRNLYGAKEPLLYPGKFQAGATAAVKRGEILSLVSTNFIPSDTEGHASTAATLAVANEEIKSGDKAGYYNVIIPRPGDCFEYALATADNPAIGDLVYYSSSEAVSTTGTTAIGTFVGTAHYPKMQGHAADDASPDSGTTLKNTSYVEVCFKASISYAAVLFT